MSCRVHIIKRYHQAKRLNAFLETMANPIARYDRIKKKSPF
jgi:hypothetical protein